METYWMTCCRASDDWYWQKCKARTLTGAKREASREYGSGYIDAVLLVATGDNITEPRVAVAKKGNWAGGKWKNID